MASATKIRVGVVGVGFGRYGHVPALKLDPRCEVAAICATSIEKARQAAQDLVIPQAYSDFRQMIEKADLDAVSIATPPDVQAIVAMHCLQAGKAVLAEKPLASTLTDAQALEQLAREKALPSMVDFTFPEIEAWQRARKLLREGAIGSPHTCVVQWLFQSHAHQNQHATWKTEADRGGGVLSYFASHALHNLEWFMGPITVLTAALGQSPNSASKSDTSLFVTARTHAGANVSLSVCCNAILSSQHRLEFYGDEGSLRLDSPNATRMNGFTLWAGKSGDASLRRIEIADSLVLPEHVDNRVVPLSRLIHRLMDWIETKVPAQPNFGAGLRVQTLIEAITASSNLGKRIEV